MRVWVLGGFKRIKKGEQMRTYLKAYSAGVTMHGVDARVLVAAPDIVTAYARLRRFLGVTGADNMAPPDLVCMEKYADRAGCVEGRFQRVDVAGEAITRG